MDKIDNESLKTVIVELFLHNIHDFITEKFLIELHSRLGEEEYNEFCDQLMDI